MRYISDETIVALSTATGGAISVIRMTGPKAISIADTCFSKSIIDKEANTTTLGNIVDEEGRGIDNVVVALWKAPHSYTGEDVVEISCHGSKYIANEILNLFILKGARMAEPGEYTKRAFLNGKMDLSQAEAVADLIASSNRASHQIAINQLRGHFSSHLQQLRSQLLKLTSLLELELDFSDHEELEFADRKELLSLAEEIDRHISRLSASFETGQAIKRGIPVAIVGKTNVGKSTLLNRLIKDERAIVSDIHGTTRDTIEDCIDINGITFRFIDTAGIRQSTDTIEQIGIERTFQAIEKAKIILWVIDSMPTKDEREDMEKRCQDRTLITVWNKIDLEEPRQDYNTSQYAISISAKKDININALEDIIYKSANIPEVT
jgi:tRNA modification GTPase